MIELRTFGGMGDEPWYQAATPSLIWDRIVETDAEIKALGRDIVRAYNAVCTGGEPRDPITGAGQQILPECYNNPDHEWQRFMTGWSAFINEWSAFKDRHTGWFSRFWGATYEQTKDYMDRLLKWRAAFEALGGKPSTPKPDDPRRGTFPWKVLLYSGIALGAVYVGARAYEAYKK